jgi:hypothetical protein
MRLWRRPALNLLWGNKNFTAGFQAMPNRPSDKNISSVKYKRLGSAGGKVIRSGLAGCAAADINSTVILCEKNSDTNTGSEAREARNATWNLGTN